MQFTSVSVSNFVISIVNFSLVSTDPALQQFHLPCLRNSKSCFHITFSAYQNTAFTIGSSVSLHVSLYLQSRVHLIARGDTFETSAKTQNNFVSATIDSSLVLYFPLAILSNCSHLTLSGESKKLIIYKHFSKG